MQLGMIGLGRMGANMVRRLMRGGHPCVAYDRSADAVEALVKEGATGSVSLGEFASKLAAPRAICLMVPAGVVDSSLDDLLPLLSAGDTVIDGGNSHYQDSVRRAQRLAASGLSFIDMGTSGGVWGLERGFCLMIGGDAAVVNRLDPLFATLAPGPESVAKTPGRKPGDSAERGYLHCGPSGAGHFVKMVHNGIEYGLMAAYAEGLNVLKHANVGKSASAKHDAETAPLRNPEHYQYDFDLPAITEVWRRGSVVASWLLDLTAAAFVRDAALANFAGRVSDSGEGRWTLQAANDEGVPAHVLAAALFERFASRGEDDFQNRVLSAMRFGFGGHAENK
ncbi:MAG TPA: decarboxylating 6-phosphogluconate dehydrogenase [Vicinamibacterales bacterium]|jgi:6-phosphogluconate dehydrogenase|nr:decarboxylating 6-phosphogluconate dehydrogenase [Vicinamibacterales bacterium]